MNYNRFYDKWRKYDNNVEYRMVSRAVKVLTIG